MASHTDVGTQLSSPMAFIFVFNLLLGAGALALPNAFAEAGWLVSSILLCVLCFSSFVSASFMCEGMAIANVLSNISCPKKNDGPGEADSLINDSSKDEYNGPLQISQSQMSLGGSRYTFRITKRIEMAEMAEIFFNRTGVVLFYIAVIIYLYGDLAIYTVAVPKSLANVTCYRDLYEGKTMMCWKGVSYDTAYRIYVLIYVLSIGSFVFFNAQKTALLQIFSSVLRHTSFFIMIVIAMDRIAKHNHTPDPKQVATLKFDKIPDFIGVSVYCFMCQHSLPSFITPMKNQTRATLVLFLSLLACLIIYILVCYTATFAFTDLADVYTLNFADFNISFIRYFLEMFPVFCLSASYPIIGITLRNNLKTLFYREREYPWLVDRIVFPLVTIVPPTIVGLCTRDVEFLVTYTGAFSGAAIQYIIPASFVLLGRKQISEMFGRGAGEINRNHSIFSSNFWPIVLLVWSACCIGFVTYNKISAAVSK